MRRRRFCPRSQPHHVSIRTPNSPRPSSFNPSLQTSSQAEAALKAALDEYPLDGDSSVFEAAFERMR